MRAAFTAYFKQEKGIYPLVTLRILFGGLMAFGGIRFWWNGWIEKLYLEPDFFFKFYGFEWVTHPGETGIYLLFVAMILGALGIMFGFFYRITAPLFFLTFCYIELLDASNYLNHYYLVCLLAFLLLLVPAHRAFSLDIAWRKKATYVKIPAWCIDIFILQLVIVYTFAGIAKLNADWLFQAMPLRIWLPEHRDIPVLGYFFAQEWIAYAFSWGGAFYDLTIAYFLLWRKTRPFAYLAVVAFHLMTWLLFNIGLFPFIMIFNTLIFFSPKWHERFYSRWKNKQIQGGNKEAISFHKPLLMAFLTLYFLIQVLLPLRHFLYPGSVLWTEEAYRFAWRVMLVEKSGNATFFIHNPQTNTKTEVINSMFISPFQEKQVAIQPDFMLQYAQHLSDYYQKNHQISEPKITVESFVVLNGRPSKRFIKKDLDLIQISDTFAAKAWILK